VCEVHAVNGGDDNGENELETSKGCAGNHTEWTASMPVLFDRLVLFAGHLDTQLDLL